MRSPLRGLARVWRGIEWPVVWALALAAVVLGMFGWSQHAAPRGERLGPLDLLYRSLQLFVFESGNADPPVPWTLEAARFLAPLVAVYTASKALLAIFADQMQQLRLWRLRDHVVVAGGGRTGRALARAFRARGYPVAVVERDGTVETLAGCREGRCAIVVGDATDPAILRRARLHRARNLIAVCGDDGVNAEIAVAAHEAAAGRGASPLSCVVHVFDPELWRLLSDRWFAATGRDPVRLEFFNLYEKGARALLDEHPPFGAPGVEPIRSPHLLVAGLGRFGESVVVRAARGWRRVRAQASDRFEITVVDREARAKVDSLGLRHPGLGELCAIDAQELEVGSPDFERGAFLFDDQGRCRITIAYVCFDDDSLSLSTALTLHAHLGRCGVPVVARMEREAGLASLLGGRAGAGFADLHAFGLLDRTCKPELVLAGSLETLARALHERYRREAAERGETSATNPSMAAWAELPDHLKESNRHLAASLREELAAGGFEIAPERDWRAEPRRFTESEIEVLARLEHDRWMAERLRDGWRWTDGAKDIGRRRSPDLVPWEDLTEAAKEKDRVIFRVLPELLGEADYALRRSTNSSMSPT
ncbi:MAG TPA: NAD-binding protein [Gemmatimonadota bacterium]|jgi:hypothetical protein